MVSSALRKFLVPARSEGTGMPPIIGTSLRSTGAETASAPYQNIRTLRKSHKRRRKRVPRGLDVVCVKKISALDFFEIFAVLNPKPLKNVHIYKGYRRCDKTIKNKLEKLVHGISVMQIFVIPRDFCFF